MSNTGEFRIPPRQRILEAADDLFRRVGIRGVGVEAIAEAAGTNKMTLYRHFESKDELIAEWVRGLVEKKFAEMEERGSALGNALAELPERDHPARRVIDEHRIREHARVLALCREARFPEADLAADQFYMLLEGAKACVHCIGLKRVGEHLMRSVDALIEARKRQAAAPARR